MTDEQRKQIIEMYHKRKHREKQKEYMARHKAKDPEGWKERRMSDKLIYYKRGRKTNKNSRVPYTIAELDMILAHEIPDRELAKKLGRSIQAIQICRSKMKANYKEECKR